MMLAFVLGVVADEERKGEPLNKRKRQQSRYTSKRIDEKKLMYNWEGRQRGYVGLRWWHGK